MPEIQLGLLEVIHLLLIGCQIANIWRDKLKQAEENLLFWLIF